MPIRARLNRSIWVSRQRLRHIGSSRVVWASRTRLSGTGTRRLRPRFLIIGAQRAATTSLHRYLSAHPNIMPAFRKEVRFFSQDVRYHGGTQWYHSLFPYRSMLGQGSITFEATPEYLYYPRCAERIHSYDPDMRLIAVLRDPVERAYSAWDMFRGFFQKAPGLLAALVRDADDDMRLWVDAMLSRDSFDDFATAIVNEIDSIEAGNPAIEPSFVRRGLYYEQLLRYLGLFDHRQVFVTDSRSLANKTALVLSQIVEFLGLPEYNYSAVELSLLHVRHKPDHDQILAETRALLSDFYGPWNERLYELLDRDLGWQ